MLNHKQMLYGTERKDRELVHRWVLVENGTATCFTPYMSRRLQLAILSLLLAKTAITTLFRGVYPFASHFAEALHIPTSQFFVILSFGELVGAFCPLLGATLC